MKQASALFVGNALHVEFRRVATWLEQHANMMHTKTLADARKQCLLSKTDFDIIVIGASRPYQYLAQDIHTLRQAAPLSRLLALLGSWCEGELRSGHPWPGVYRTYWHQWPARLGPELDKLMTGQCPVWGHALTMTPAEEILCRQKQSAPLDSGLVVVHATDRETVGALRDACQHLGYATVCSHGKQPLEIHGATAIVLDIRLWNEIDWRQLHKLSQHYRPTPLLVTLSFPRHDVVQQLLSTGAHHVLSKPFLVQDFAWLLNQITQAAPNVIGQAAA